MRRKWRGRLAVVVAVLLGLGLGPTAWVLVMASGRTAGPEQVPASDVAVVLGAGLWSDGSPMPYLRARLDLAAQLYANGRVRAVLVSGDNRRADYNEPDAMRGYLIDAGVPADKVVADYAGVDTYSTCVRARVIFGVEKAIVVSQSYHLPRAIAACRSVGIDTWGVGDQSVQKISRQWPEYSLREWPANVKLVFDLLRGRQPVLGEPETSIAEALG